MAGGKGTRLSSITKGLIPKPMVKLNNIPILEHQIKFLRQSGITNIIIVIGHLGNVIKEYFRDGKKFQVNIQYIEEKEPLGSAGSLFFLKNRIKNDFFLIFGDTYFNIDLQKMFNFHISHTSGITLFVHPNSHPYDSDLVECDNFNRVLNLYKKTENRPIYLRNLVNAAFFILNPKVLSFFDKLEKVDMENDLVKSRITIQNDVYAYKSSEYIRDAGTTDRLESIEKDIKNNIPNLRNLNYKQNCIFLDRDGTINKFKGFISTPEKFELLPNIADAIRMINESRFLSIIVTNQPVIARGECSINTLNQIHGKMDRLLAEKGAFIDALYYCPHHPDKGFKNEISELKFDCNCRKPKIGLFEKASKDYNIEAKGSFMIGDSDRDILFGKNAGLNTVFVESGEEKKESLKSNPDYCFTSLREAVAFILNRN